MGVREINVGDRVRVIFGKYEGMSGKVVGRDGPSFAGKCAVVFDKGGSDDFYPEQLSLILASSAGSSDSR